MKSVERLLFVRADDGTLDTLQVEADPETPFSRILDAAGRSAGALQPRTLRQLPSGTVIDLFRRWPGTDPVASPPGTAPDALEIVTHHGPDAGRRVRIPARDATLVIGRGANAGLRIDDDSVSGRHVEIRNDGGTLMAVDLGSRNGTLYDDRTLPGPVRIEPDHFLRLGSTTISVTQRASDDAARPGILGERGQRPFNRPPRPANPSRVQPIDLPAERREEKHGVRFSVAALVAPLVVGGVMALIAGPRMALFALMSPVFMLANYVEDRRRRAGLERKAENDRDADAARVRAEITTASAVMRAIRERRSPDLAELRRRAELPALSLWERRPGHDDFLCLTLGLGTVTDPLPTVSKHDATHAFDDLLRAGSRFADAPVNVTFGDGAHLGIVGPREGTGGLARSLLCQLATLHGPADVRIAVASTAKHADEWKILAALPHARDPDTEFDHSIATESADVDELLSALSALTAVEERAYRTADRQDPRPLRVLVVDDDQLLEHRLSTLRPLLQSEHRVCMIILASRLDRLPSSCHSVVQIVDGSKTATYQPTGPSAGGERVDDLVPSGVTVETMVHFVSALAGLEDTELREVSAGVPRRCNLVQVHGRTTLPSTSELATAWRQQAMQTDELRVPLGVSASGVFEVDLVQDGPHGLIAGTTGSGKSELLRTLVAGLALRYSPSVVNFVLIDYKGGSAFADCALLPHTVGMVTDLDASLSMRALQCLEAELRFRERLLAHWKAKDLLEYGATRMRQRSSLATAEHSPNVLHNVLRDVHDVHDVLQAPIASDETIDSMLAPALPRLLVVIDEFATLAKELPDFIASLVGIAQRGRSLGVHLILATQRPTGAVNDNIRANTNIRIALRVNEANGSSDVIDSPDAAAISRRTPGRAIARLGPSELETFQAAMVTATERAATRTLRYRWLRASLRDPEHEVISLSAESLSPEPNAHTEPRNAAAIDEPTDLGELVRRVARTMNDIGAPMPRKPWPDPLPFAIDLEAILPALPFELSGVVDDTHSHGALRASIGMADVPHEQRQDTFAVDVRDGNLAIVGMVGSGATTTLTTLASALLHTYSPTALHVYAIDAGTQSLFALNDAPHVGAVVGVADVVRQDRLVTLLTRELDRRRELLARSGGSSIAQLAEGDEALPSIVLLIDNYGALRSVHDDAFGMSFLDRLHRIISEGTSLGVHVAVTCDRLNAIPVAVVSSFPQRLVHRLGDPIDYSQFGLKASDAPAAIAGRAIDVTTRQEVQIAHSRGGLAAFIDAVRARWRNAPGPRPPAVRVLGEEISVDELRQIAATTPRPNVRDAILIPIGLDEDRLAPQYFTLGEGETVIITGPSGSGRSNLLRLTLAEVCAGVNPPTVRAVVPRRSPLADDLSARGIEIYKELASLAAAALADNGPQLLLIDDADFVDDPTSAMAQVFAARRSNVWVMCAARQDGIRTFTHWTLPMRKSRQGFALRPQLDIDGDLWSTPLPRRSAGAPTRFPIGRGYLIYDGTTRLVQTARIDE